jgi:hypothetical protein
MTHMAIATRSVFLVGKRPFPNILLNHINIKSHFDIAINKFTSESPLPVIRLTAYDVIASI